MFTNKVVVITGAGGGIGRHLVEQFLEERAIVWGIDKDETALAEIAEAMSLKGVVFHSRKADIANKTSFQAAWRAILKQAQQIDVLVNNAGIEGTGAFGGFASKAFARVMAVNLDGTIEGTRLALDYMEDRGKGLIVNVASLAGHMGVPFMSAYVTSKFGVVGFTRALQTELELLESPVRLALVSPGWVKTPMVATAKMAFPEWLSWAVASPESTASEIVRELKKDNNDIFPTLNGKILQAMYRLFPKTMLRQGSQMLLSRSFRDYLLNRFQL